MRSILVEHQLNQNTLNSYNGTQFSLDRRANLRIQARLPCVWAQFDSWPDLASATECLNPIAKGAARESLQELKQTFNHHVAQIADAHVRHALELLQQQIDIHAQPYGPLSSARPTSLQLSADCIKLEIPNDVGKPWMALCVQAADGSSLVLRGEIKRPMHANKEDANKEDAEKNCTDQALEHEGHAQTTSSLQETATLETSGVETTLLVKLKDTPQSDQVRLMRLIFALSRKP